MKRILEEGEFSFKIAILYIDTFSSKKINNCIWVSRICYSSFYKKNYRCFIKELIYKNKKYYLFCSVDEDGYFYTDKFQSKIKTKSYLINKIKKNHYSGIKK
jgi:hypothetical protein